MYMFLNEVKFNLRMRITLFIGVFVEYNYMSLLRTTTCDSLIVPSGIQEGGGRGVTLRSMQRASPHVVYYSTVILYAVHQHVI